MCHFYPWIEWKNQRIKKIKNTGADTFHLDRELMLEIESKLRLRDGNNRFSLFFSSSIKNEKKYIFLFILQSTNRKNRKQNIKNVLQNHLTIIFQKWITKMENKEFISEKTNQETLFIIKTKCYITKMNTKTDILKKKIQFNDFHRPWTKEKKLIFDGYERRWCAQHTKLDHWILRIVFFSME